MVTTRLHTAEDLLALTSKEHDYELIEGELVPMTPVNFGHGDVQGSVYFFLKQHVLNHGLGKMVVEVGYTLQRDPDTVLAPDVSFVANARVPADTSGFAELAPDLAVEVVSPGNSPGEIERKVAIYLGAGVRAVWVVYPNARQIVSHAPDQPPRVFMESDTIDGGDVLPGLALSVAEIFA